MEVFPCLAIYALTSGGFLHVCGGVSTVYTAESNDIAFSPRMWRCFHPHTPQAQRSDVFSTYVEVFLMVVLFYVVENGFLHVCGGVSQNLKA